MAVKFKLMDSDRRRLEEWPRVDDEKNDCQSLGTDEDKVRCGVTGSRTERLDEIREERPRGWNHGGSIQRSNGSSGAR